MADRLLRQNMDRWHAMVRCHALVPQAKGVVEVFPTVFDIPSVHALVAIPKWWFKAITIGV